MAIPNPLVIPAGFAQCTFGLFLNGRAKPFSFSIGASLGADEESLAVQLATWFGGIVGGDFATKLANAYTTDHVEVLGHTALAYKSIVTAGQNNNQMMSPGVAAKVKKITGLAGKANKGYMFWPGVLEQSHISDSGTIDAFEVGQLTTILGGLVTAMAVDGSAPVILHHEHSSTTTPTPVTGFSIAPLARSQRRRQTPR